MNSGSGVKYEEVEMTLKIAKRFVSSNKAQTALIVVGIAVGVAVQVFIAVLIDSLQAGLVDTTVGTSSQVTVKTNEDGGIFYSSEEFLMEIEEVEGVAKVQQSLEQNAFLSSIQEDSIVDSVFIKGIDMEDARQGESIYKLDEVLQDGELPQSGEIMIGVSLAEKRDLQEGDVISLDYPGGLMNQYTVSGIYDLGNEISNDSFIFMDIRDLRADLNLRNETSKVELQVDDVFDADLIALEVSEIVENSENSELLIVTNWKDENAQLLSALQSQSISSLFIQIFVLISVVIAIASVLNILVVQKAKEIGILKAMGLKDGQSSRIFVYQSLILGVLGTIVGMALGLALLYSFSAFAKTEDGSAVIDIIIFWDRFIITGTIAVISATFAGILPALKTSRLNPVEIINNG